MKKLIVWVVLLIITWTFTGLKYSQWTRLAGKLGWDRADWIMAQVIVLLAFMFYSLCLIAVGIYGLVNGKTPPQ
jgi:hypothetical protein